jgi:hypothetical protein
METFAEETLHIENSEDTQGAQHTKNGKSLSGRDEQAEIGRENREEVDNAIEGENILPRALQTVDAQIVLESESYSEKPLQSLEHPTEIGMYSLETVKNNNKEIDTDKDKQPHIEPLARRSVGLENNPVDLLFSYVAIFLWQQHFENQPMEEIANKVDNATSCFTIVDTRKDTV